MIGKKSPIVTDQLYYAAYLKANGAEFMERIRGENTPSGRFDSFAFKWDTRLAGMAHSFKNNEWYEEVGPRDYIDALMFLKRLIRETPYERTRQ